MTVPSGSTTYLSPNWVQQFPAAEPVAHQGSSMAYDPVNKQVVLFGGTTTTLTSGAVAQTWAWANGSWSQLSPATSPAARTNAKMAWDPALQKLVLFGGESAGGIELGDTWTWNGNTWSQLNPTTSPSPREPAGLAWDPDLNALVLFGGRTSSTTYANDTWTFGGGNWSQFQATGVTPTYRASAGLAYSSSTSQLILFGGYERSCSTCAITKGNDTWVLGTSSWTQWSTTTVPARADFGMVYDPGLGGVLLTSGSGVSGPLSDTWAWNGYDWVQAQSGISQEPWYTNPSIAATDSGQVVWQVGPVTGTQSQTWIYDTGLPVLGVSVTNSPPNGQSTFYVGDTADVQITAANPGIAPLTANIYGTASLLASVFGYVAPDSAPDGSQLNWTDQGALKPTLLSACVKDQTTPCGSISLSIPAFVNIPIAAGATNVALTYLAKLVGNTRGCSVVNLVASGYNTYGGSDTSLPSSGVTVCGGGLGTERWWTYDTTQLGVGGSAAVNAANGNLVVKQEDSTPIQSHGQFAFELGRAYNSQDNMTPAKPGPLGVGWQWNLTATGDAASPGLNAGALTGLSDQLGPQPLSVTYVDRDGTRHVFRSRGVSATIGPATVVLPTVGIPFVALSQSDALCIDETYKAPAGADMYLFRWVSLAGSGCGAPASTDTPTLGWSVVKPNRERYDYNVQGQLVAVTDAAGNQLRYTYATSTTTCPGYASGTYRVGALCHIDSNRCPGGGVCPNYSFSYPSVTIQPTQPDGLSAAVTYDETDVTDPAGRVTTYLVTHPAALSGALPELAQVWNPDNPFSEAAAEAGASPSIQYSYATSTTPCPGSTAGTITAGALCSVTDPAGGKTTFAYTPAPLGPDRILSVMDRRANATGGQSSTTGSETVYGYTNASDGYSTATVTADTAAPATFGAAPALSGCANNSACERNNYTGIDFNGRVGEVDQGTPASGTNGNWLHQEAFYWDGNIHLDGVNYGCNYPLTVIDNELCETQTRVAPSPTAFSPLAFGSTDVKGVAATDHVELREYDDLGMPTRDVKLIDPTKGVIDSNEEETSYGYHLQYVQSDGSVRVYNDTIEGHHVVEYQNDAHPKSYYSTILGDSPSAYWRWDNRAGTTLTDNSGHGQDATENPGIVLGQVPNAIMGDTSVEETGGGTWDATRNTLSGFAYGTGATSAFSVEVLVKPMDTGPNYTVCAPDPSCASRGVWLGRANGGFPYLQLTSQTDPTKSIKVQATNTIADNNWHLVDYVYDGSGTAAGVTIYVDGYPATLNPPMSDNLSGQAFRTDATPINLGQNGASGPDGTDIDETSVYPQALTATQVQNHLYATYLAAREDPGTLYAVADQTQMLTPRGNAAANWGDYLTVYRRDVPQTYTKGQSYPPTNSTNGPVSCQPGNPQNTGLLCETDMPASAGVPAGVCQDQVTPGGGVPAGGPTDSADAHTCSRATYDAYGQKTASWSPNADSTSPAGSPTTYTYYTDTSSCSTLNTMSNNPLFDGTVSTVPDRNNCDLSGKVSAGGWLEAVTDPSGAFESSNSVEYAYDRSGSVARTWDRNATAALGKSTADLLKSSWEDPANAPSSAFTESDTAVPVTSNSLSVSAYDTEVVTPQGLVSGSGDNASGQLGTGNTTSSTTPVTAGAGLHDVVQVAQESTGAFSTSKVTYALTGSGQVYVWGGGTYTTPKLLSSIYPNLPPLTALSVGGLHILGLDRSGRLWAWGNSANGQVGNGSTASWVPPVVVMSGVATFAAGGYHSLAVKTDGTVWAWGYDSTGQLGNGSTSSSTTPVQVSGLSNVTAVAAGEDDSYAIKADGTVWAWGDNTYGNLGTGSTATQATTPQQITGLGVGLGTSNSAGRVRQIVPAVWGAAALMADGTIQAWGLNNYGQLGGAASGNSSVPVRIPGLTGQVALAGGWATYLSANDSGQLTIWGATNAGQAGTGSTPAQMTPQVGNAGYNLSPFSAPWRYATMSRDQLGNRITTAYDADGMPVTLRSARGNDVLSTADDVYSTYDAGNLLTSTQSPVERGGAGGTGSTAAPTTFTYDVFGNKTVVTDPRGNATVTDYDLLNRVIDVKTTRSTPTNSTGSGCTTTASGSPWGSNQQGHMICVTSMTYDGADQAVSVTDKNGQTTTTAYNALGEKVSQTQPRNDGTYTNLTTVWSYNPDEQLTDTCPPRQFDAGHEQDTTSAGSCPATAAYGTHLSIDNAGRVASSTIYRVTGASSAIAETTSTSYDADGNKTAVTDANGHTTTSTFDLLDRRLTMTVPRSADAAYTTTWSYDPSGDVVAKAAPGALSFGDGANGPLVVDGSTNPSTNPFRVPNGARYTTVTLQNGGWITGAVGSMGLVFTATGTVSVCATCGITMAGSGQVGGAGAKASLGNSPGSSGAIVGGNGGGGGKGSLSGGGGGGGGGHNGPGAAGATSSTGGAGGLASGTTDFSDVGTNYTLAAGGGGGGAAQGVNTTASSAGGNGGGFIHITAPTVTVDGTITAAGVAGTKTSSVNGGSGGGAGGGIWLTASTVNLSAANDLTVAGGAGATSGGTGGAGGKGAPGYMRIDADVLTNSPNGIDRTHSGMLTGYSYDADHRLIDTVTGFQGTSPDVSIDNGSDAIPDSSGYVNERTRLGYDADGHQIIAFSPRAFTDSNSLLAPKLDYATRTDFDADGRPVAKYSPRYDTATPDVASGGDGGTSADQQATQCAVGADPSVVPGYDAYPGSVGVCIARTTYDANGNVDRQYMASSNGSDNRYQQFTYTDDNLKLAVSTPDPSNPSGRVTVETDLYDGDGRIISTTDVLGHTTVTKYTADGLVSETDGQSYTQGSSTIKHVVTMTYNANGQQVTKTQPDSVTAVSPLTAADYTTTTTWTSDGLTSKIQAPGVIGTTGSATPDVTSYSYDAVGNPLAVKSPSANAADANNLNGVASVNTYTYDNLILATSNPVDTGASPTFRVTNYAYTPSGQKASSDVGTCTSATLSNCVAGKTAFTDGAILRYTYAPDGVNVDQIGRDSAAFGPSNGTITTTYNQAGEPTRITTSDTPVVVTAGYYLDGLPRTASDGANSNTYAYDGDGALTLRTDQTGSSGVTGGALDKTSFSYADSGLPAQGTSDVTGTTSTWSYDQAGRPTLRTDVKGSSTVRTVSQSFNPDNTINTLTDSAGGSTVASNTYTYDDNGQIISQAVGGASSYTNTYTYNPAGNVTSWNNGSATTAYKWDHDSNRLSSQAGTTSYNADNTVKAFTPTVGLAQAATYTPAGELASMSANNGSDVCSTQAYDDFQRTAQQVQNTDAACGTTAKSTTTYTYDGLDRTHVTKAVGTLSTITTQSFYDGTANQLVGQTGASNGKANNPTVLYQLNPNGAPVAFTQTPSGGGTAVPTWLNRDTQGNVTSLLDVSATSASCVVKYDPFGNPQGAAAPPTGNGVCASGSAAATTGNAIWFASQVRDATYGTYQLGSRTYNPATANFSTPDTYRTGTPAQDLSVGTDPLTQNTYTYVNGNPINLSDPDGHDPWVASCDGARNYNACHNFFVTGNPGPGGIGRAEAEQGSVREYRMLQAAAASWAAYEAQTNWNSFTMAGMPASQFYGIPSSASASSSSWQLNFALSDPTNNDSLAMRIAWACLHTGPLDTYCPGTGPQPCAGLACGSSEGVGEAATLACEIWCGPAILKGVFKGVGLLRAFMVGSDASPWLLSPFQRGLTIENKLIASGDLGEALNPGFPVVDAFDPGTGLVTSIKSIDLTAQSYQSMSTLSRVLEKYVDSVAAFDGGKWGSSAIRLSQITQRALLVAVPKGAASMAQWNELTGAITYGARQGVGVKFVEVP